MTSYRIDYDTNRMVALRLPVPGPETNKWYVEIPGMAAWLERMKDAYRWCSRCLVARSPESHEAHLWIHRKDGSFD